MRHPFILLAVLVLACTDAAPPQGVSAPPAAPEVADAWTRAYNQFVEAEYPHADILLAHTVPWMLEHMPGMTPERARSEWLRDWDGDERRHWLRRQPAEDGALAWAMDGAAAYVRGIAEGGHPATDLLDDMRALDLEWPGPNPMPSRPGVVK